uniref:Uncharacterized protein n=1 Tax=Roseihalotalea indica TaxID=2867963 RepID=A0AA49GRP8_9BACT|nr:hypothetical protein K4G66_08160 [Tunicatimonas sp. TK19036]
MMKGQLPTEKTEPDDIQFNKETIRKPDLAPMTCPHQGPLCEVIKTSNRLSEELKQLRKAYRQLELERNMLRKAFFIFHEDIPPQQVFQQHINTSQ